MYFVEVYFAAREIYELVYFAAFLTLFLFDSLFPLDKREREDEKSGS